jgi:hypothetical protein
MKPRLPISLRWLAALLLIPLAESQAAVWPSQHQWNEDWENRFGQWLSRDFTGNIFTTGKYAGTQQDCADAVYFARLVFAYENKLPFVIGDPKGGGTISSETSAFDNLPPPKRFRRFMDQVGNSVSTNTMMNDTYPIALNRDWFRPGVVAALPRTFKGGTEQPGHDQIVTKVERNGVIHYLKSTVPAKVHKLEHTTLIAFVPTSSGGSFRYWKQPQHYGRAESSLPGYSTEQYSLKGDNEAEYADQLQKRLALVDETKDERLSRLSKEICHQVEQRVPIVDEAWTFKKKIGSRCMTYEEFDSYSTPSRDTKIKKALQYLLLSATGSEQGDANSVAKYLSQACGSIQYLPGKQITAVKFAERLMAGQVSSDPNQPPSVRWGDEDTKDLGCKQYY